jgi:uncharacterized protein (TIGR02145 family)
MKRQLFLIIGVFYFVGVSAQKSEKFIDERDGKKYTMVVIGDQTWTGENLNVSTFRNGDTIPEIQDIEAWLAAEENQQPAWCYYDNDPSNGKKYGKLYNWYAVNDPRGLAPEGWHVASEEDWEELVAFIDDLSKDVCAILKSDSEWPAKQNGSNEYGFNAIPGGRRKICGNFDNITDSARWWTSTPDDDSGSTACGLTPRNEKGLSYYYSGQTEGFSVRCVKD